MKGRVVCHQIGKAVAYVLWVSRKGSALGARKTSLKTGLIASFPSKEGLFL